MNRASSSPSSTGRRAQSSPVGRLLAASTALAAVALFAAGCATQPSPPDSMRDPTTNFTSFKTYGWTAGGATATSEAPVQLLDKNIRTAISGVMNRKGYVAAPEGTAPDLRIAYETTTADKIENNPVRVGIGVGSWGGNMGGSISMGSPSVRNFTEGTLVIHAIDNSRNAEVWQGRVSGKMTKGSLDYSTVNQAVVKAMQDFPAR